MFFRGLTKPRIWQHVSNESLGSHWPFRASHFGIKNQSTSRVFSGGVLETHFLILYSIYARMFVWGPTRPKYNFNGTPNRSTIDILWNLFEQIDQQSPRARFLINLWIHIGAFVMFFRGPPKPRILEHVSNESLGFHPSEPLILASRSPPRLGGGYVC